MGRCYPAQKVLIRTKTFCRLPLDPLDFRLFQRRRDRPHDTCGHLVLKIEDVLEPSIETVRPEMRRCCGVYQLCSDAHPICRLSDAAFEQVAHAELPTDLPDVDNPPFV